MDKHYDPQVVEARWSARWQEHGAFHAEADAGGEPYCIVIPPPNVTGILHIGHVLNNSIQDILIRWRRMQGRNALWMPGMDHAGIATQNAVEKALKKEGQTRDSLGREAFIERVWDWKSEKGGAIIGQLKRLGASCDWERERFTMDEGLSNAVEDVFIHLYDKGLIYRGNRIINWCPRCQTALSDEESPHEDSNGQIWNIRYPLKDGDGHIVVATTRPETLLGDVAVAMNPDDDRYGDLKSKTIMLPIVGRELVVIEDDYVDPEFGTGLVKVTPAHDPNDFEMGQRHNLEPINVMNDDGTMNDLAGDYAGMERFACRKKIVADLEEAGLIESIEDHRNAVGHCYRCDSVVEPRLSLQWFVRMEPLAKPAIECVKDGRVRFVPSRWDKVYMEWMENIRDWCISRQIWWGHRIPVFYCNGCDHEWASKGQPDACPACGTDAIRQDEDVLDTWFSSWLWPFSTFGWPEQNADLKTWYPGATLVTGADIIFFWVARMIMAGMEFMGDVPFRDVYIHGIVRDEKGRKISKSLGNFIDPLEYMDEYSADALRFSLMMILATGHDLKMSTSQIEVGRNFGTKVWNAARFVQMQTGEAAAAHDALAELDPELLTSEDRFILHELNRVIAACTDHLERYRFNDLAREVYGFVWHRYCDWYVEYSKTVFYGENDVARDQVLRILHGVLAECLKLLHPIMPYITEELWHSMGYAESDTDFLMKQSWPTGLESDRLSAYGIDEAVLTYVERKHELIRTGRMLKADLNVPASKKMSYFIVPEAAADAAALSEDVATLEVMLHAGHVQVDADFAPEKAMPSVVVPIGTLYMEVDGHIDVEAEIGRLSGQREKLLEDYQRVNAKLANKGFVDNAPAEVVSRQEERRDELKLEAEKIDGLLKALGA